MLKKTVQRLARQSGYYIADASRLGLDADLDVGRLSAESPLNTIFDVGANFGQTAIRFANAFPTAKIYSFEPVPASFARLRQEVDRQSHQIEIFNVALGETVGNMKINIASHPGSNSFRPIHDQIGSVDVSMDTIDRVCDSNSIDTVDLLKLDVEGFELEVLRGASRRIGAGKVRFVYAECVIPSDGEKPHTSFFDLHQFLADQGFCFVSYYAQSFRLRTGCATGNVLYALQEKLRATVPGSVHNIT